MVDFHNVRLPIDIEVGAQGGPAFMTDVVSISSGAEQRNEAWDQQRHVWDISYGIQSGADAMVVKDFFYARRGRAIGWLFRDWSDFTLTNEVIASNASPNVCDGKRKIFHITRTYGGAFPYVRYITQPDWATITVKVNGITTGAWTQGDNGTINFTAAPALNASVTVSGEFNIPMRFNTDHFMETIEAFNTGTITALAIVEVRINPNNPPVSVDLSNTVTSLPENTSTGARVFVADVYVNDDGLGANAVTLSGADLAFFEFDTVTSKLYLKAGTVLNHNTKPTYNINVGAVDTFLRNSVGVFTAYSLAIATVNKAPAVTLSNLNIALALNVSTAAPIKIADITVADPDVLGTNVLTLTGADAASFSLVGTTTGSSYASQLFLNAGVDTTVARRLAVNIVSTDATVTPNLVVTVPVPVTIGTVPSVTTFSAPGTYTFTVTQYTTLKLEVYAPGCGAWGFSPGGPTAPTAPVATYIQNDQTVTALQRWHLEPFRMADNPNAWVPGQTVLTAKQASFGLGAALMASLAGQFGALGASTATSLFPGRNYLGGKGGDAALFDGTIIAGGAAQTVATPDVTVGGQVAVASVAGINGAAPSAGGSGGVYKQTTGVPDRSGVTAGSGSVIAEKDTFDAYVAGAGSGFYASHTWTFSDVQTGVGADYKAGAPAIGAVITIVIGAAGVGGAGTIAGGNGGAGRAVITLA